MAECITRSQLVSYLKLRRVTGKHGVYWNSQRISLREAIQRAQFLSGQELIVQWYDHIVVLPPAATHRIRGSQPSPD